jgi:hypothetical protein
MGSRPTIRKTLRRITAVTAWLLAATFILSGAVLVVSGLPSSRAPFPSSHHAPIQFGAAERQAASASLARGEGPAVGHPSTLPISPGGYTWTNVSSALSNAPSGRVGSLTWDASDGYVLLFGWATIGHSLNDTWSFVNGNWTNLTASVGTSPPQSEYQSLTFDPSSQKVVMFYPYFNATWTYHNKVWANITGTAGAHPPAAMYAQFVTDSTDNEALYFGGQQLYGPSIPHDTWAFKNGTWSNITGASPFQFGNIQLPIASDDPADHGVLAVALSVWHSTSPALVKPTTFLFSGGTWTNLTPSVSAEPPMTELATMAYLPSISTVVFESDLTLNSTGNVVSLIGLTWEFSHGSWTNVTAATGVQPDDGIITTSAVDPGRGTMVMFSGERLISPAVYPATWLFSAPPVVTASASKSVIDAGQSVTLTGTVSLGAAPFGLSWNPGDGSSPTNASLSISHSYSKVGETTATFTVRDEVGHAAAATASFYVNPALVVSANATPASANNGTWVALVSQVTGGSAPFTYAWSLGDGATGTTPSLAHAYSHSGNYTVNVTVTDAAGAVQSATFVVAVHAAPAPSHPASSGSSSVSLTSGTGLGLLLGILVLLVVVVVLAVLLMRRPKSPPGTLTPYASTPPASPAPPPGAGGPPGS